MFAQHHPNLRGVVLEHWRYVNIGETDRTMNNSSCGVGGKDTTLDS